VIHVKINRSKSQKKQHISSSTAHLKTILRLFISSSSNLDHSRTHWKESLEECSRGNL